MGTGEVITGTLAVGGRLDKALAEASGMSRERIKTLIGQGHVVLFAANPIYRGETLGSYFMVFNTILNFDSLDAGRKLDLR